MFSSEQSERVVRKSGFLQFTSDFCVSLLPADEGGEGAEDRLGVAAGAETELGAAVIEEIEFHVVAAEFKLLVFLLWCVSKRDPILIDGKDRL